MDDIEEVVEICEDDLLVDDFFDGPFKKKSKKKSMLRPGVKVMPRIQTKIIAVGASSVTIKLEASLDGIIFHEVPEGYLAFANGNDVVVCKAEEPQDVVIFHLPKRDKPHGSIMDVDLISLFFYYVHWPYACVKYVFDNYWRAVWKTK